MSWIDYLIFGAYMAAVLGIGVYHFRRNGDAEDYYVGGRSISPAMSDCRLWQPMLGVAFP